MSDRNQTNNKGAEGTPPKKEEDKEQNEMSSDDIDPLHTRIDTAHAWMIVMGAFFIGGVLSEMAISSSNWLSFLIFGGLAAAPFWVFLTESGLEWLNNIDSSSVSNKPSSSTKECPNCGWHNHQANNNCVDCGETFPNRSDHQQTNHSKHICKICGWQNPHNNNYCIDCGNPLNE